MVLFGVSRPFWPKSHHITVGVSVLAFLATSLLMENFQGNAQA